MHDDQLYCQHQRSIGSCEECAYEAAKAAGRPVPDELYRPEPLEPEGTATEPVKTARTKTRSAAGGPASP